MTRFDPDLTLNLARASATGLVVASGRLGANRAGVLTTLSVVIAETIHLVMPGATATEAGQALDMLRRHAGEFWDELQLESEAV